METRLPGNDCSRMPLTLRCPVALPRDGRRCQHSTADCDYRGSAPRSRPQSSRLTTEFERAHSQIAFDHSTTMTWTRIVLDSLSCKNTAALAKGRRDKFPSFSWPIPHPLLLSSLPSSYSPSPFPPTPKLPSMSVPTSQPDLHRAESAAAAAAARHAGPAHLSRPAERVYDGRPAAVLSISRASCTPRCTESCAYRIARASGRSAASRPRPRTSCCGCPTLTAPRPIADRDQAPASTLRCAFSTV